jgi:DNA helicase HerA-like ATPase
VDADLDALLTEGGGGQNPVTSVDVSRVPAEALATVVGTLTRIVYDALFWAMNLPVGGRAQPLLLVVDEAHLFVPRGGGTPANRALTRVAKEGRKYGVGLMLVSQRPSDLDPAILDQCGTVVALRVSNASDRGTIAGAISDDLGGLAQLLPSLRTGEALVLGEALQVPSRVRVRMAINKPIGNDPALPAAWQAVRPDPQHYKQAVRNWRHRRTSEEE